MSSTRLAATRGYYLMKGVTWLCFMTAFTLGAIYRIRLGGLGPLELILVGTALEVAIFACEIPTGVVADVRGRRLSMTLAFVVMGVGFVFEGLLPYFPAILVAQLIFGVGYTLLSGAEDAWLADEVGEQNLAHILLRGNQIQQIASLGGIALAVALGSLSLRLPFLVAGLGLVALAFWVRWMLPETGFAPTPPGERGSWGDLHDTLRRGLRTTRRRPLLLTMLAIAACYGLSSEGLDRLWEAHLLENFTLPSLAPLPDLAWFGGIHAVAMLGTLGLSELVRRRSRGLGHRGMVFLLCAESVLMVGGLLVFALGGHVLVAIGAYLLVYVVRHCGQPLRIAWINQGLDSRVRATVLSTVNQGDAVGQLVGGPMVGAVGSLWGLRVALASVALLLAPVWALYARALGQGPTHRDDTLEDRGEDRREDRGGQG